MNENAGSRRPGLTIYHPNGKGSGCAVVFALHPAHDDTAGSIMLTLANQKTVGDVRTSQYPTVDWENKMTVRLDFPDLCKILQVLRGECESIDDGRGLYHSIKKCSTRISFRHVTEPCQGYALEVHRTYSETKAGVGARIMFTPAESLGLTEAISASMPLVAFGIPMVIPRRDPTEQRS